MTATRFMRRGRARPDTTPAPSTAAASGWRPRPATIRALTAGPVVQAPWRRGSRFVRVIGVPVVSASVTPPADPPVALSVPAATIPPATIPPATVPPVHSPIEAILLSISVTPDLRLVPQKLHLDFLPINHAFVHVLLCFDSLLFRLERQGKTVLHRRHALLQLDSTRAKHAHDLLHVRHRDVSGDAWQP